MVQNTVEGPPLKRQKLLESEDLLPSDDGLAEALTLGDTAHQNASTEQKYDEVYDQDFYKPTGFGEMGLYLRNKRKKLAVQRQQFLDNDPEKRPPVFDKIAVYINGHTNTPLAKLSSLLVTHGGEYVPYLDAKGLITHIVASELTPKKREEFAKYKVVTEDWILDSVAAGRVLDWRQYRLYGATKGIDAQMKKDATGGMPSTQLSLLNHVSPSKVPSKRPLSPPVGQPTPPEAPSPAKLMPAKIGSGPSSEWPQYLPQAKNARRSALLDDEEWRLKHTAAAGMDYIEGYYATSRLHHLSTWKAALPQMVDRLRKELKEAGKIPRAKTAVVKPSKPLKGTPEDKRIIFHVDFDSFFVACGLVTRPHLRGKPVAVCHASGNADAASSTSEIASCSYEARECGVKNGISLGRARELCPDIQAIPYEFDVYARNSEFMYKTLLMVGDQIEAVSVDEAFIDVSSQVSSPESALKMAEAIRTEVRNATGCEVSIGISYNIVLSRLATKRAKPASAYFLRESETLDFLGPLSVDEIPGVGWAHRHKLEQELGVKTLADVLEVGRTRLVQTMGPTKGESIYNYARGIDIRTLKPPTERKSVSVEINYGIRFHTDAEVEEFLRNLSQWLSRTLSEVGVRGKHLTLKVMRRARDAAIETPKFLGHGHCDTINTSADLGFATSAGDFLSLQSVRLMQGLKIPPQELRGIALQMTQLDTGLSNSQQRLSFGAAKPSEAARAIVEEVASVEDGPKLSLLEKEPSVVLIEPDAAVQNERTTRSRSATPAVHAAIPPRETALHKYRNSSAKAVVGRRIKRKGFQQRLKLGGSLSIQDAEERADVPINPTSAELEDMGIDPIYWSGLTRALQLDAWIYARTQLQAQQRKRRAAHDDETAILAALAMPIKPLGDPMQPKITAEPKFKGQMELDDIENKLEVWINALGDLPPVDKDVAMLRKFVVAKSDRRSSAGPDLGFVIDLLKYIELYTSTRYPENWREPLISLRRAVEEVSGMGPLRW